MQNNGVKQRILRWLGVRARSLWTKSLIRISLHKKKNRLFYSQIKKLMVCKAFPSLEPGSLVGHRTNYNAESAYIYLWEIIIIVNKYYWYYYIKLPPNSNWCLCYCWRAPIQSLFLCKGQIVLLLEYERHWTHPIQLQELATAVF